MTGSDARFVWRSDEAVLAAGLEPWSEVPLWLPQTNEAFRHFLEIAAPARVMAVVKADGYGHGALEVARAALEAGASWLGTAHISEALKLRSAGFDAPILAWLHTPDSDFDAAINANVDLGISGWELEYVAAAAKRRERYQARA